MVQTISIDKLTPQKLDKIDKKDVEISNTDFLELLLKDINSDDDTKEDKSSNTKDDEKISKLDLKDNIENKLDFKIELNSSETNKKNLEEIKNIITSKFKQENIILSKQEIKEFKQIDNLKDLVKFADKKGLNIEKLNFDIETPKQNSNIKQNKPKISNNETNKEINNKPIINTNAKKNEIKSTTQTKIPTSKIIKSENKPILNKETINITKNTNTASKEIKANINESTITNQHKNNNQIKNTQHKPISLEDLISKNNTTKENNTEINNKTKNTVNIKQETKINTPQINNNTTNTINSKKLDSKTTSQNSNKEIKEIKHTTKKQTIDLSSLIKEPETKTKPTKKIETNEHIIHNNSNQNMINEIKAKTVQAKETINHFKQNLDEAIKNYKPPISKVDIELNPKNLGKVEVSIIQRGNNIQVNMNTDQNNVMLFQTHQAEFRQALANIGFSNIDMNFNSNQDKERKQNQAKKSYKDNEQLEIESDIEIKATYQYA